MKKHNIFKILTIVILITMVLSYFIPGTTMGYGSVEKGTILPVTFANTFTNSITSFSAFITLFIYILVIGVFYAVLKKTDRYETLVDNTASVFDKIKGLFVVITVFALGLSTLFTGELYTMLIFIPFLISVLKKLGFSKYTSILATVGSTILGFSGSLYTMYANQFLSLTVKDNLTVKITLALIGLVSIVAFILVFNKKPVDKGEVRRSTKKKMLPIYITFILMFVLLILGFVNWEAYFGFTGFNDFLTQLREAKVAEVSIFDAIIGNTVVAFGNWQPYNAATLFTFVTVLIALIYRVKINDFFESLVEGLEKAFPYAMIMVLANIVLVNIYSSGVFYTLIIGITEKTINVFNTSISGILASLFFPDYAYASQFTLSGIVNTTATNYQSLFAVGFQAIYALFLLISPTSIILLFALRKEDISYGEWIKYIIKYFLVLLFIDVLVIAIFMKGFNGTTAIFLAAIIVLYAFIIVTTKKKIDKKEDKKVEVKVEKKEDKKVSKPATKKTTKKVTKK